MIDNFFQFVLSYNPRFKQAIEGASEDDINQLERTAGVRYPTAYREFLATLGKSDGGLLLFQDARYDVSSLLHYYRNTLSRHPNLIPSGYVLVAVGGVVLEQALLNVSQSDDAQVDEASGGTIHRVYADSFTKLLFKKAFAKYRPNMFSISGIYLCTETKRILKAVKDFGSSLGFQAEWFSDSVTLCLDRRDAVMIIQQYKNETAYGRIAAESKDLVESLGSELEEQFGLRFHRWGVQVVQS